MANNRRRSAMKRRCFALQMGVAPAGLVADSKFLLLAYGDRAHEFRATACFRCDRLGNGELQVIRDAAVQIHHPIERRYLQLPGRSEFWMPIQRTLYGRGGAPIRVAVGGVAFLGGSKSCAPGR
jgi:hypothetical protein